MNISFNSKFFFLFKAIQKINCISLKYKFIFKTIFLHFFISKK